MNRGTWKQVGTFPVMVAMTGLWGAGPGLAATRTTPVNGEMGITAMTCLQGVVVAVGTGENCMYDGGPSTVPSATPYGEVTGPFSQIAYYDHDQKPEAFSGSFASAPGDGKINQVITGSVTVDDNDTPGGDDDQISFTLTLTSPAGGDIVRNFGSGSSGGADRYASMTQVLPPTTVHAATANGEGGFDYVIGSEGFPALRTFTQGVCTGQPFGSVDCNFGFSAEAIEPNGWSGVTSAGIGSLENSFGAKTIGSVTGLACISAGTSCTAGLVSFAPLLVGPNSTGGGGYNAEDVGWDNLLFRLSTNASGRVTSAAGFDVQEYRVFMETRCLDQVVGGLTPEPASGTPTGAYRDNCNSWSSGHFTLAPGAEAVAEDDGPFVVQPGVQTPLAILTNDSGFTDPVTVTVTTPPGKGTVTVTGSPGNIADITVSYTANAGSEGEDSFVYTVTDAFSVSDTATTAVVIGAGANPDTATTRYNTPVPINVGSNDTGLGESVTVTIDGGSFSHGGSASVTTGNGGPADTVVVTYVPSAPLNTPTYVETFSYTIDDGELPPFTALVSVTVNNLVPVANDGVLQPSTQGVSPGGISASFAPPGPGAGASLGDAPAVVTISVQGTRGTATVGPSGSIVYTITDDSFYTGTDSITYIVTDADGDNDSGVVTISVPDVAPAIPAGFIVTGVGRTSVALDPAVTAGNGPLSAHALAVSGGTNGTCTLTATDGTGKVVYEPDAGYAGSDSCMLSLTDADGDTTTGTVTVTVTSRGEVGGASATGPWSLLGLLLLAATCRRRRTAPLAAALALPALLLTGTTIASAQDAPAETPVRVRSNIAISEIVVTARKVEESLQSVPLAITAFDENAIEAQGITSLDDVAALTPGLSFFNAFGENLPVPVIRGIAPTDIFGQNNAAIFVDGVYISGREGLNFSQLDIARIEVVKGPQSALYGRNAFSGAINYVTREPAEDFEAKTGYEVGNRGKIKAQGSISGPLWGDQLRGRIAALYDEWDGSYDNALVPENDIGGYRYRSLQAALLWQPLDAVKVNLSYYRSDDDIDEAATVSLPTNCEDRVNDNNATTRFQNFCGEVPDIEEIPGLNGGDAIPKVAQATGENRELDRANLRIEWDLYEHGMLSALTGYSKTRQWSVSDFGRSVGESMPFLYCPDAAGTPGAPASCGVNAADQRLLTGIYDPELGDRVEEWSQELRYSSAQDQRLRYTVGGYLYTVTEKAYPGGPVATQPLPDGVVGLAPFDELALAIGSAIFYDTFTPDGGLDPLQRLVARNDTDGWALFTGADFDFTDRLTGRAELRYSQEQKSIYSPRYRKCDNGDGGSCVFDEAQILLTGDDRYDLREIAPLPLFGADCRNINGDPAPPGQCSGRASARFESVTGRLGLDWQINDDWMIYGSVAYGEKPGGVQLVATEVVMPDSSTENRLITSDFEPEELTAYELGVKGTMWDGRMTISSSVFYNDWKEIVLRQLREREAGTGLLFDQPRAFNINSGDAEVLGFEIEANVAFTEGLSGRFTVGWVDAEIKNAAQDTYETFPSFAPDGDVSGNDLLRQPEWLWSASLSYAEPFGRADWEWYVSGDANYQSGIYVGNDNQGWLPEHTYVNTKFGVRSGVYTIEFWARNILNDNGATAAFRDIYWANNDDLYTPYRNDSGPRPNFDGFVPLRYTVSYPRQRTYGLSVAMRFGAAVR